MRKIIFTACLLGSSIIQAQIESKNSGKCPVMHGSNASNSSNDDSYNHINNSESSNNDNPHKNETNKFSSGNTNKEWWPNQLDLSVLRQNSNKSNPMGSSFDYKKAFNSMDYFALKEDIRKILTQSQEYAVSGMVACGFWSLWSSFHSYGLA
jgi:catalase-peroxidase